MEAWQIGLPAFLVVLELALLGLVASILLVFRGSALERRVRALRRKLKALAQAETPEPVGYDQYLRDGVLRNRELMEQARASDDEAEKRVAELLAFREKFLELELEAVDLEANPVAFQDRLAAGLCELVEAMRPEAAPAETEPEAEAETEQLEEITEEDLAGGESGQRDTSEEEIRHLKDVINNQHDAMRALRAQLEERAVDTEGMEPLLEQLDAFEQQSEELERCLKVLEAENERLRQQAGPDGAAAADEGSGEGGELQISGLKSMVGSQQETILGLRKMVQELVPEADKAQELEATMDSIQRTNQELSSCVAVLEDENAMLRAELESVAAQLEVQEKDVEAGQGVAPPAIEALEIKVQELEALVEFKDATIEELEKQYADLEERYAALSQAGPAPEAENVQAPPAQAQTEELSAAGAPAAETDPSST